MNVRQEKKRLKKWSQRMLSSRENGELIRIITQSKIEGNKSSNGLPIKGINYHKPRLIITKKNDKK